MIFGKLWHALSAQFNKIANLFWTADPIAQMQYEYDLAVDQLVQRDEQIEQMIDKVRSLMAEGYRGNADAFESSASPKHSPGKPTRCSQLRSRPARWALGTGTGSMATGCGTKASTRSSDSIPKPLW